MPKMKAKKISVNAIGNPIKITNNIAPIMIRPIVGLSSDGLAFIISVNAAPPGTKSGKKIANTSQVSDTKYIGSAITNKRSRSLPILWKALKISGIP